jgi:hypothetical protein
MPGGTIRPVTETQPTGRPSSSARNGLADLEREIAQHSRRDVFSDVVAEGAAVRIARRVAVIDS